MAVKQWLQGCSPELLDVQHRCACCSWVLWQYKSAGDIERVLHGLSMSDHQLHCTRSYTVWSYTIWSLLCVTLYKDTAASSTVDCNLLLLN